MKKIYLIYAKIPTLLFDSKMHEFVHDSTRYILKQNHYIGLYAWTDNKILLDAFLEFRKSAKNMYKVVTRNKNEFTKYEFKMFRKDNFHEELLYYRIPTNSEWMDHEYNTGYSPEPKDSHSEKEGFFKKNYNYSQIVCTRQEYEDLFEYAQQNYFDYMSQVVKADYIVLKREYQLILDAIGYCDMFNEICDDDENDFYWDRHEATEYSRSYKISYYGNKYFDIYENKVALFINTFYEMIVGYKNGDAIKVLVYK